MSRNEGFVEHHPVRVIRDLANRRAKAPEASCDKIRKAKKPSRKKKKVKGPARKTKARKKAVAVAAVQSNESDTEAGDAEAGDAETSDAETGDAAKTGDPNPERPPSGMTAVCKSLQRARAKKRSKDEEPLSYADKLSRRLQTCRDMRGRRYNIKALRETRHKAVMKGFCNCTSFFLCLSLVKVVAVVTFHVKHSECR